MAKEYFTFGQSLLWRRLADEASLFRIDFPQDQLLVTTYLWMASAESISNVDLLQELIQSMGHYRDSVGQ